LRGRLDQSPVTNSIGSAMIASGGRTHAGRPTRVSACRLPVDRSAFRWSRRDDAVRFDVPRPTRRSVAAITVVASIFVTLAVWPPLGRLRPLASCSAQNLAATHRPSRKGLDQGRNLFFTYL